MYIDNLIGLSINLLDTDNIDRAKRAPLLAIYACSFPIHKIGSNTLSSNGLKQEIEGKSSSLRTQDNPWLGLGFFPVDYLPSI